MTGPEHYRTAETLLANIRLEVGGNSGTPLFTPEHQTRLLAEAQVHATLALTASQIDTRTPVYEVEAWMDVTA